MTHLSKRIDRLEAQRNGGADAGPSVIFLRAAGGEIRAAVFVGGGGVSRLDSETEAAFIDRVKEIVT